MNKSNNRFLLILIALMLAISPLRGMSASSMDMGGDKAGDLTGGDSPCPHMNMGEGSESSDSGMQMDCCKSDCNSDTGCDNVCSSCVHANAGITGPVVFVPVFGSTTTAPILFSSFSNHSFAPLLRPPAQLL